MTTETKIRTYIPRGQHRLNIPCKWADRSHYLADAEQAQQSKEGRTSGLILSGLNTFTDCTSSSREWPMSTV